MRSRFLLPVLLLLPALPGCGGSAGPSARVDALALPGDGWPDNGRAIAYSGYREEQSPRSGVYPSREQVEEDLRILARHWTLIRVYSANRHAEDVLDVIRGEGLDLKVMLGIWLAREPGNERANAEQIAAGIRLANEYRDVVLAVNVGNETLIEWTEHPVPERRVIRYVREVKAAVDQPVTVADNYVWWRDHGAALAREIDFITMHSYPIWERRDIDAGLSFTIENYRDVRAAHPGVPVAIGEAGWATYTEGNLHVPRAGGEEKQRRYYEELTDWAREAGVTVFWFEAFDEPWKGPGTEGHWGLFTVDRTAKPAMRELYPDLLPDGPTSPAYPERIGAAGPDIAAVLQTGPAGAIPDGSVNHLGPGLEACEVVSLDDAVGGTALRLAFSGDGWAGLYLFLGEYDAGDADAVTLRAKVPADLARLELKIEAPETNARSVDLIEYAARRDDDGWTTFVVPLTALDGIDPSRIAILGVWNPRDRAGAFLPCEVIVDDIGFGTLPISAVTGNDAPPGDPSVP